MGGEPPDANFKMHTQIAFALRDACMKNMFMRVRSLVFFSSLLLNVVAAIALFGIAGRFSARKSLPARPVPTNHLGGAFPLANGAAAAPSNAFVAAGVATNQSMVATATPPAIQASTPAKAEAATHEVAASQSEANPPKAIYRKEKIGWQDVETPKYAPYLDSLRAVGCPEEAVQNIILNDVDQLFAQKRLKEAMLNDQQWWRPDYNFMSFYTFQEKTRALQEQKEALLQKLLGPDWQGTNEEQYVDLGRAQLTGPILGKLPPKTFNSVQEICDRAMARHQSYMESVFRQGQQPNQVELAKMREQTRSDLAQVLDPAQMEEFLLRHSFNANNLRQQLRPLNPSPEEFRKVFRATDQMDHQMQLDYGSSDAMSSKQRDDFEDRREDAIRKALGLERYQAYVKSKDPIYRQAQLTVQQLGVSEAMIMPLYQTIQQAQNKKEEITKDASLTPQQKSDALQAVQFEHQKSVQQILGPDLYQRYLRIRIQ